MSLRCGIVGLPNVGKSTLFNALTASGAALAANYPFATIEPNMGVVPVPDERLSALARLAASAQTVPATIEFVDIAGLVAGASKGEGLGNQFLAHIREVDAIVHVVRCFEDGNVIHVSGRVDPASDKEVIDTELLLKDLETVEKRIERQARAAKTGEKKAKDELAFYERLLAHLSAGNPARAFTGTDEEAAWRRDLFLITDKPILYAANVAEADLPEGEGNPHVQRLREIAAAEGAEVVVICADLEAQIAELDPEERAAFLEAAGLERTGLERLIQAAYRLLGLITYFTAGPKEARAWTIRRGTKAPGAAGVIHSDFERGFIRAETIKYRDYERLGTEAAVREAGLMRSEGRDYTVEDGDVMLFRFNV
jgi:ribosome-binding ATPase